MPKKKKKQEFDQREADQIEEYYKNMTGAYAEKSTNKHPLVKVIITLVIVLIVCAGVLAGLILSSGSGMDLSIGTIDHGVTVAGVDVGGMNKSEAIATVSSAIGNSYTTNALIVTVNDQMLEISPAVSGANLDVEAAVDAAFDCGSKSNPQLQADLSQCLNLDMVAIQTFVRDFAKLFPTEGVQSGWEILESGSGDQVDKTLSVTVGSNYYDFDQDALLAVIMDAYNSHSFSAVYTCNQLNITSIDLDVIATEHCVAPVDAILDPETYEVTQSSVGYTFDLEKAKEALANAEPGETLLFPFEEVEPEMSSEQLQSMLFRDVLGTYTAYQSSSANRATNLRLACEALDGIILYPGDVFGYNETLGERTPEKGYKPAASYFGNKTIQSYGGGICQPSSTLYYCTLMADLEIVQRHCHSYVSSYVPMGMDATVDWSGPDFKFRNNTDFPIRIDAEADGGSVTISLVGTDVKDYYVKMEYEVLSSTKWETVEIEIEPGGEHKDGEVETSPYTGYTVQTYKLKYSKETDELISREKEAFSAYSKRDKVVYKVVQPEETTVPTEPTVPPTTAPTESTVPPTTAPTEPTTPPTSAPTEPTVPPTTAPPATDPPATDPPATEAPVAEQSITELPEQSDPTTAQ